MDANPLIEDIDAASTKLQSFVASIERISEGGRNNIREKLEDPLQGSKIITPQLITALGTQTHSDQDLSFSQIYDSLAKSWISTLSKEIPGRVRGAIEKRLREIATYIYFASFGVLFNAKSVEYENGDRKQETVLVEPQFNLPVRRKRSLPSLPVNTLTNPLGRFLSPLDSSQISEDTGLMLPSSTPSQLLAPTLPTPEMTPSLRSRSSISSIGTAVEDAASERLRVLASLTPQPALPASASDILRHWTEGMNPDEYDWEAIQDSIEAERQDPGDVEDEMNAKKRQRLEKRLKRQRENALGSSSQPPPTRAGESQPSPTQAPQRGSSVGVGVGIGTMNKMGRGPSEGGRELGKRAGKKKRRQGF